MIKTNSRKKVTDKRAMSLPQAIAYLVVGLAFSITVIYSLFILLYSWVVEDNIFNRLVAAEASYIEQTYQQSTQVPSPRSGFMTLHKNWQQVPQEIIAGYKKKSSRVEYSLANGSTIHLRVLTLGDSEYILLADVEGFEVSRDYLPDLIVWLIIAAFFSSLLVSLLAFYIAKRITSPIKTLADQVKGLSATNIPPEFADNFPDNEVKSLASTIEHSFTQLQTALQREINFTRDVSHEIRTPISVLKNALELNKSSATLSAAEFEQVSRASSELEKVTNTLLALARKESSDKTLLNITEQIENAVLSHFELNHSIKGKALTLDMQLTDNVSLMANQNLLQILFNNLLSNIVQYATAPQVHIKLCQHSMSFSNQTSEQVPIQPQKSGEKSKNSIGIGHGLSLIERICEINGWLLEAGFEAPQFTVTIHFAQQR